MVSWGTWISQGPQAEGWPAPVHLTSHSSGSAHRLAQTLLAARNALPSSEDPGAPVGRVALENDPGLLYH